MLACLLLRVPKYHTTTNSVTSDFGSRRKQQQQLDKRAHSYTNHRRPITSAAALLRRTYNPLLRPPPTPLSPLRPRQRVRPRTMYSRRILSRLSTTASSSTPTAARPFTTASAQWNKYSSTPALSDIAPEQGHVFDAKQKEFRENLAEQNRKRKEQERQSASIAASSSSAKSSSSHDISSGSAEGLGSLSSVAGEAARQNDGSDKKKGTGRLSSLIYGTEEGREMDREIERSFSQVLARGKYVHSVVFHEVKPDKVDEYVELVGSWYPRMASMPENKVHLVGSWRTEVGDCDTFGTWQGKGQEGSCWD